MVCPAVRKIAGEQIIHGDAEGIQIGAGIGLAEAVLFRSGKVSRSHQPGILILVLVIFLSRVEVDQLDNAVAAYHDIGRFDIAVYDRRGAPVERFEDRAHGKDDPRNIFFRKAG